MKNSVRTNRYRAIKRADILAAAEAVFASKGFARTTMEEIARKAEFATGTIYLYYRSKEDLYATLLDSKAREYLEYVRKRVEEIKRREDKLNMLVHASMQYMSANSEFFKIYLCERERLVWHVMDKIQKHIAKTHEEISELFRAIVAESMRAKVIKRSEPRKIAVALMGLMSAMVREWSLSESKMNAGHLSRFILDVFLHGVRDQRGKGQ